MKEVVTVMIGDEDCESRKILTEHLRRHDVHIVFESDSGKDLIENMERVKPDVLIIDVLLKEMNGIEVIKQLEFRETVRVFIVSAYVNRDILEECRRLGVEKFFRKPVDTRTLTHAVLKYWR